MYSYVFAADGELAAARKFMPVGLRPHNTGGVDIQSSTHEQAYTQRRSQEVG
jgi:hypothetical protein